MFSSTAYLGSVAVATEELRSAYVSQHIALVRVKQSVVVPEFVGYFALGAAGQVQLIGQGYGGTKVQLALGDVKDLWLPVPPIEEQREIVRHLDAEARRLEGGIQRIKRLIQKLRERRTALISAAVTGKIRVADQAEALDAVQKRNAGAGHG